jgi:hypothetical protein
MKCPHSMRVFLILGLVNQFLLDIFDVRGYYTKDPRQEAKIFKPCDWLKLRSLQKLAL